ncbi:MAG: HAMP domain-containing sensor histidine kinase [Eubacteriales bacterium]|nr:HAMP domain-containing sensor histidine kinase [Eubacteriales bacterium]
MLKIDSRSIKFKTWLYFILFAAVLMATLWVVQVFMLNNFYGTMKTAQTENVVKEIESSYRSNETKDFVSEVDDISDSYDMFIYVVSFDGKTTYFSPEAHDFALSPGISSDSESTQRQYALQIQKLNEKMLKNNGSAQVIFKSDEDSQDILAFARVLTSKKKETIITYVFSPLWPVSSTIKILQNQLVIVTIISLALACLISFYLSFRITRPIRKIEKTARKLAAGEYGVVFPDGHYTEISNLSDTLTGASIELEKSCMMQKDLVANVSHDLRTPLTMIKSYAEMIRDISGDNPEKREEHLQVIINETDRLNILVNDLLSASKLQSGKITIDRSIFNLSELTEEIIENYRGLEGYFDSNLDGVVDEKDKQFHIDFDCNADFMVEGDAEKIKQVVSNFISNGIKFCGEDETVVVSIKRHGRFAKLSVEDHGSGIAPNDLEHIWDRYYRASSNMARETEGTGLGLSICKEILTLHKADFGVDSKPGEGTCFWFNMELKK